jgi:hypothetical protein
MSASKLGSHIDFSISGTQMSHFAATGIGW